MMDLFLRNDQHLSPRSCQDIRHPWFAPRRCFRPTKTYEKSIATSCTRVNFEFDFFGTQNPAEFNAY